MAIFIPGMKDRICGKPMHESDETIAFQPFVFNEDDPLYFFSDSVFHKDCFEKHPLRAKVMKRYKEYISWISRPRIDRISGNEIKNPDDCISIGFITEDKKSILYKYNYSYLSKKNLSLWNEIHKVHREMLEMINSGIWKGSYLERIITQITL
jgi:hypothetical protein